MWCCKHRQSKSEKLETTVAALQQNISSLNEKFSIWTTALQPVIDKVEKGEEF